MIRWMFLAAAVSLVAIPAEGKRHYASGHLCQSTTNNSSYVEATNKGIISKNTTSEELIWCPHFMNEDFSEAGSGDGPFVQSTVVHIYNGTGSASIECAVKYRSATGALYTSPDDTAGSGYQTLGWYDPFSTGGAQMPTAGMFGAACYLPISVNTDYSAVLAIDWVD